MGLPDDEFEREHESYGLLQISRVSGGTGEFRLFGSALARHYGTIRLRIAPAKWIHGLHYDRYHGSARREHIEIEMSAAQFAEAITSLNMGSGTPCTVRYIDGKRITEPPDFPTEAEHIRQGFEGSLSGFKAKMDAYRKKIEKLTEKLSGKARDEIRIALDVIIDQLDSNVPFVLKQFQEATSRITTAAKNEVEAFVTHAVQAAGLQAIASKLPPLLSSGEPEDKNE